jgi:hypothetical protein
VLSENERDVAATLVEACAPTLVSERGASSQAVAAGGAQPGAPVSSTSLPGRVFRDRTTRLFGSQR